MSNAKISKDGLNITSNGEDKNYGFGVNRDTPCLTPEIPSSLPLCDWRHYIIHDMPFSFRGKPYSEWTDLDWEQHTNSVCLIRCTYLLEEMPDDDRRARFMENIRRGGIDFYHITSSEFNVLFEENRNPI